MITTLVCSGLGLLGNLVIDSTGPLTTPILALRLFTISFTTLFALHASFALYYKLTGIPPEED
jgi:hypothetical protein